MASNREIKITIHFQGQDASGQSEKFAQKLTGNLNEIADEVKITGDEFERFGKKGKKGFTETGAGAVAAGQLVADFVRKSAQQIKQFIGSVTQHTLEFRRNSALVQNLGADIGAVQERIKQFDPVLGNQAQLLESYFRVYSGGVTNTKDSLGLLEDAARLAFAEQADLNNVVQAGIKIWNIYGSELGSTTEAFETLSMIAQIGDTNLQAVSTSIARILPFSKSLNISLQEVGATFAILTQASGSTELAATNLASLLRSFNNDSREAAAAAEALQIEWSGAAVEAQGLYKYLGNLREALAKSGKSQAEQAKLLQDLTGRAEGAQAIIALLGDSFEKLKPAIDQTTASAGVIGEKFKNMDEAIGPVKRFEAAWANLQIELGEKFIPTATAALQALSAFLPVIQFFLEKLPILVPVAIAFSMNMWGPKVVGWIKNWTTAVKGASLALKATGIGLLALMAIDIMGWLTGQAEAAEDFKEINEYSKKIKKQAQDTADIWEEIKTYIDEGIISDVSLTKLEQANTVLWEEWNRLNDLAVMYENLKQQGRGDVEYYHNQMLKFQKERDEYDKTLQVIRPHLNATREAEEKLREEREKARLGLKGYIELLESFDENQLKIIQRYGSLAMRQELIKKNYDALREKVKSWGLQEKQEAAMLANIRKDEIDDLKKLNEETNKRGKKLKWVGDVARDASQQIANSIKAAMGSWLEFVKGETKLAEEIVLEYGEGTQQWHEMRTKQIQEQIDLTKRLVAEGYLSLEVAQQRFIVLAKEQFEVEEKSNPAIKTMAMAYDAVSKALKGLSPWLDKTKKDMGDIPPKDTGERWKMLYGGLAGLSGVLKDAFGTEWSGIENTIQSLGALVQDETITAEDIWNKHWGNVVSGALQAFGQIAGGYQTALGGALQGAGTGAQMGGGGLGSAIGAGIGAVIGGIIGAINEREAEKLRRMATSLGRDMGAHLSMGFVTEMERRIQDWTARGFAQSVARWLAEMEMIPAALQEMGKISEAQFARMLQAVSAGIDHLGHGYEAYHRALPAIVALLDQVDQGFVRWSEHISSLISGLVRTGLATDEVLEKAIRLSEGSKIKAWLSSIAAGVRMGEISLGHFTSQLTILMAAAEEYGLKITGQLKSIFTAAKQGGWELEDVVGALTIQIEFYRDSIRDLRDQIHGFRDEIEQLDQRIADTEWRIFKQYQFALPKAEEALLEVVSARNDLLKQISQELDPTRRTELMKQLQQTEEFSFTRGRDYWQRGVEGDTEWQVKVLGAGEWTGMKAFEELQKQIEFFTKSMTKAMTPEQMIKLVQSVNPAAQYAVSQYLETVQQGIKLQLQLDEMKLTRDELKEKIREVKHEIQMTKNKIIDIKQSIKWIENHWHQIPDKLDQANYYLGGIKAGIDYLANKEGFQSGGFIPESGLAMVHAGEYVLTAQQVRELLRGDKFLASSTAPVVPFTPPTPQEPARTEQRETRSETVIQPIYIVLPDGTFVGKGRAEISENRIREIVWDEMEHGDKPIPGYRVDENK